MDAEHVTTAPAVDLPRAIRADIGRLAERMERMEGEMRVIRGHIAALVQSFLNRGSELASLTLRVDRIERRLDLTDGNP
jgi:hypothetical protein